MNRTIRTIFSVVLLGVALAGCSKDSGVGEGLSQVKPGDNNRIGTNSSTTTEPPKTEKTTPTTTATTAKPVVTPPPPKATPCTKFNANGQVREFINIGDANQKIDPSVAGFRKGAKVCWKNVDSVPHSIQANNGAFKSPSIAPGAQWEWIANQTGRLNYQDPDRPFVVAELQIQ